MPNQNYAQGSDVCDTESKYFSLRLAGYSFTDIIFLLYRRHLSIFVHTINLISLYLLMILVR